MFTVSLPFLNPRYGIFLGGCFSFFFLFVCGGGEKFNKVFGQHVFWASSIAISTMHLKNRK